MKQFKLAITFGRFNLLHCGHIDLFHKMGEMAEEVFIGVSTGPDNYTYRQRADIIQAALKADPMDCVYGLFPERQPFGMVPHADAYAPSDVVFVVGEDQHLLAKAIERSLGFKVLTIKRLTSSTTVRTLIDGEDWDLLSQIVPGSIISQVTKLHLLN